MEGLNDPERVVAQRGASHRARQLGESGPPWPSGSAIHILSETSQSRCLPDKHARRGTVSPGRCPLLW